MKKKILFRALTLSMLTPIITFSCTSSPEPRESKTPLIEVQTTIELTTEDKENFAITSVNYLPRVAKVTKNILDKAQDLIKSKDFVPPTAKKNLNKLAPSGITLNKGFFDTVPQGNKLHDSIGWIRITNKNEFNQIIINRFKELNNKDDVITSNSEIKQEFEKNYLNNQDVYRYLENNDIFIADIGLGTNFASGAFSNFVIPFDSGDSIVLNVFPRADENEEKSKLEDLLKLQSTTWAVFGISKGKNITIKILDFFKSGDQLTGILEFFPKLFKWYNTEYVNFYTDETIE